MDGEGGGVGAEDESAIVEAGKAKVKGASAAYGVEIGLLRPVEGERGVVAVDDDDGSGGDEGCHGFGLLSVCPDGDEALPVGLSR